MRWTGSPYDKGWYYSGQWWEDEPPGGWAGGKEAGLGDWRDCLGLA